MCGIIGYTGSDRALDIILPGLARLEYRGYDSAGVALLDGDGIFEEKAAGKLSRLRELLQGRPTQARVGLGHTRWATHGAPTRANAHPHLDCGRDFAIVHNGIIENYRSLRVELEAAGHRFASDTDTETVVHLIESLYRGDLRVAVQQAIARLDGSFALGVIARAHPGVVIAARKGSPLIVGCGEQAYFIASDATPLLAHTREVIYLDEQELAELRPGGYSIFDKEGHAVQRRPVHLDWTVAQAERGGYAHFMLKEIHEQPQAIAATVGRRRDLLDLQAGFTETGLDLDVFAQARRVILVACGTAFHAGLVGRLALEELARVPASVEVASEFRYGAPVLDAQTLVVAISQSGETADTLECVRLAQAAGAPVLSICNVQGASIPRQANGVFYTHAGPEISVASTKAYTTQLTALNLLAIFMGGERGVLDGNEVRARLRSLRELPELAQRCLGRAERVAEVARSLQGTRTFFFIGRRYHYASAFEGALKLKEITYRHAEGYGAGEMKHGPIALVDQDLAAVALLTRSSVRDKMRSNVQEIRARGGRIVALVNDGDESLAEPGDGCIVLPETPEPLSPILAALPLQLLAYYLAVSLGRDVDQPRNLAKSVTVE